MNYDEIKAEQLVSDNMDITSGDANMVLDSLSMYIEESHSTSPLARYHNMMVVLDQVDEIYHQTHNEALDYLREKYPKDCSGISHDTIENEAKKVKFIEKDDVIYQLVQVANFRNLATKDKVLNSLIISEKETQSALNRIQAKITKRIGELRATKEFKKAKPTTVSEVINLKIKTAEEVGEQKE